MTAGEHQQVGVFVRDDGYHSRCSCDWISGGCRTWSKATFRWNVHVTQAALDARVAKAAKR